MYVCTWSECVCTLSKCSRSYCRITQTAFSFQRRVGQHQDRQRASGDTRARATAHAQPQSAQPVCLKTCGRISFGQAAQNTRPHVPESRTRSRTSPTASRYELVATLKQRVACALRLASATGEAAISGAALAAGVTSRTHVTPAGNSHAGGLTTSSKTSGRQTGQQRRGNRRRAPIRRKRKRGACTRAGRAQGQWLKHCRRIE